MAFRNQTGTRIHNPKEVSCGTGCARCCINQSIPITIMDVERIAQYKGVLPQEIFTQYIEPEPAEKKTAFMLNKQENLNCAFLNAESMCTVYDARPRICEFFLCSTSPQTRYEQIINQCTEQEQKRRVLEHAVSLSATRSYIETTGLVWDAVTWKEALTFIREYSLNHLTNDLVIS